MATYRYVTADVLTGRTLEELPLKVDSFSQQISAKGDLRASLALAGLVNAAGLPIDWRTATVPKRSAVYVIRDDTQVVWGGIITAREPATDGISARITAETFEGYLARRRVKTTLAYGSPTDVFTIVRDIIAQIQAVTGGNIRLAVSAGAAGYSQAITYNGYARTKVLDELVRLSEIAPGFEFTIRHDRDNTTGVFTPTLVLVAGQMNTGLSPILAEQPGNMLQHPTYPETVAANAVTGVGKGDGPAMLIYEAVDPLGELANGYPIYEDELSVKEEDDLGRLTARTQTDLATRLVDAVVPTVTLKADGNPSFGSYPLGVPCRLRITSPYFPANANGAPGLDITRRVTGWTVTPPSAGNGEQVTLALSGGTYKITAPIDDQKFARWLRDVESRVRTIETAR